MLLDPKFEIKIKARLLLLAAADYLEAHGWCQQHLRHQGRVCMMGAINAVNCGDGTDPVSITAIGRLRDTLKGEPPARWNDKPGRTKAQVVRALRRAAGR